MKTICVIVALALMTAPAWAQRKENLYRYAQGTASVTEASKTANILAGITGAFHHVERVVISCHLAATGGGGVVNLNHGSTTIFTADADAVGVYVLDFGERGHRSGASGDALQLEVASAVTDDASCIGTAISHVMTQ